MRHATQALSGADLLSAAAEGHARLTMLLGDPPRVVAARLLDEQERRLVVLADPKELGSDPAEGHLVLVQLMHDGRSVAFHTRVTHVRPTVKGAELQLDRPHDFLVMQARRAFRVPARGLEVAIELDLRGLRDAQLADLSLGGAGVQINGNSVATGTRGTLRIAHESTSLVVAVRVVACHGDIHGLELLPAGDLQKERLRKLVMGVERAWLLRERRVR